MFDQQISLQTLKNGFFSFSFFFFLIFLKILLRILDSPIDCGAMIRCTASLIWLKFSWLRPLFQLHFNLVKSLACQETLLTEARATIHCQLHRWSKKEQSIQCKFLKERWKEKKRKEKKRKERLKFTRRSCRCWRSRRTTFETDRLVKVTIKLGD